MNAGRILALGSYTPETGGRGDGIRIAELRDDGGCLDELHCIPAVSPSYLLWRPSGDILYAAHEHRSGAVSSFRFDAVRRRLELIATVPVGGARPCHIGSHPSGRMLAVSNWEGGSISFLPVDEDGTPSPPTRIIQHVGSGAHPTKQDRPHPHTVVYSRDGRFAIILDGGLDTLTVHRCDPRTGDIDETPHQMLRSPRGSGPRHATWSASDVLAVVEELTATISTYRWSDADGILTPLHRAASSREGSPERWPSEIQSLADRRLLTVNRAGAALTLHDMAEGRPAAITDIALDGANPRHAVAIGSMVVVALQDSDRISTIDLETGVELSRLVHPSAAYVAPRPS